MVKAFSYIRYSSKIQSEGDSHRRQLEGTTHYCERHGLELDATLNLKDLGVSAWKGRHTATGALGGFLDACKRGMVERGSYLIIECLDRLSRQHIRQALALFFQILDAGITIVTLKSTDKSWVREY